MPDRIAGLKGRKPQKQGSDRLAIGWLHDYSQAPAPTYPIDVSQGITAWQMLGNDTYGDCVPAAVAHDRMLAGAKPTTAQVEKEYLTYDDNEDNGVNIADYLLWRWKQGLDAAFAPVALETVDAVMAQFGRGVLLGVNLTDADMQRFNNHEPWIAGTPDPNEGHGILKVKADSPTGNGTIVTWGADQICEQGWQKDCIEEAWIILTADDAKSFSSSAWNALIGDIQAIAGAHVTPQPTPTPTPVPTPTPSPQPTPVPAPTSLDALLAAVLKKHYSPALKDLLTALVGKVEA